MDIKVQMVTSACSTARRAVRSVVVTVRSSVSPTSWRRSVTAVPPSAITMAPTTGASGTRSIGTKAECDVKRPQRWLVSAGSMTRISGATGCLVARPLAAIATVSVSVRETAAPVTPYSGSPLAVLDTPQGPCPTDAVSALGAYFGTARSAQVPTKIVSGSGSGSP